MSSVKDRIASLQADKEAAFAAKSEMPAPAQVPAAKLSVAERMARTKSKRSSNVNGDSLQSLGTFATPANANADAEPSPAVDPVTGLAKLSAKELTALRERRSEDPQEMQKNAAANAPPPAQPQHQHPTPTLSAQSLLARAQAAIEEDHNHLEDHHRHHHVEEDGDEEETSSEGDHMSTMTCDQVFRKYDADGSGTIDREELRMVLHDLGVDVTEKKLEEAFSSMDTDGDGDISFAEFDLWWIDVQSVVSSHAAWDKYDEDGNGNLDEEELQQVMDDLGIHLSGAQLRATFRAIDLNGDGDICFEEFSLWWTKTQKVLKGYPVDGFEVCVRGEEEEQSTDMSAHAAWDKYDVDSSGNLDKEELASVLIDLGVELTPGKLHEAFVSIDTSGVGEIFFNDFKVWWHQVQNVLGISEPTKSDTETEACAAAASASKKSKPPKKKKENKDKVKAPKKDKDKASSSLASARSAQVALRAVSDANDGIDFDLEFDDDENEQTLVPGFEMEEAPPVNVEEIQAYADARKSTEAPTPSLKERMAIISSASGAGQGFFKRSSTGNIPSKSSLFQRAEGGMMPTSRASAAPASRAGFGTASIMDHLGSLSVASTLGSNDTRANVTIMGKKATGAGAGSDPSSGTGTSVKDRLAALSTTSADSTNKRASTGTMAPSTDRGGGGGGIKERMARLSQAQLTSEKKGEEPPPVMARSSRVLSTKILDMQNSLAKSMEEPVPKKGVAVEIEGGASIASLRNIVRDSVMIPGMGSRPTSFKGTSAMIANPYAAPVKIMEEEDGSDSSDNDGDVYAPMVVVDENEEGESLDTTLVDDEVPVPEPESVAAILSRAVPNVPKKQASHKSFMPS